MVEQVSYDDLLACGVDARLAETLSARVKELERTLDVTDSHLRQGMQCVSNADLVECICNAGECGHHRCRSLVERLLRTTKADEVRGSCAGKSALDVSKMFGISYASACAIVAELQRRHTAESFEQFRDRWGDKRSLFAYDYWQTSYFAGELGGDFDFGAAMRALPQSEQWSGAALLFADADIIMDAFGCKRTDAKALVAFVAEAKARQIADGGLPAWTVTWTASTALKESVDLEYCLAQVKAETASWEAEVGTAPPKRIVCPITEHVMFDPVVAADGGTYERAAIEARFAKGDMSSPMDPNETMADCELRPSPLVAKAVRVWRGIAEK